MSEWVEYKLEDIAEIHNSKRVPLSSMQRSKKQGIYPYYGASGIVDYIDSYAFEGEHVLISEDGENLRTRKTPVAFKADGKFWVNNHAHIVKGKKEFHNDLITYYFSNLDLNEYITGAVQPKLNKSALTSIPFYLPSNEDEQKSIVEVLRSLDDKIDILHRQNKTLEAMAEALFRQWFVEGAGEDWPEVRLNEVVDISIGRTPPRQEHEWFSECASDIKWISIKDMGNQGVYLFDTSEYLTKDAVSRFNIPVIPENTVVLSFKMTVGRVGITTEKMLSNEAIAHFVFKDDTPFTVEYLYIFLKSYKYEMLGSTSSIVTAINSAMIKDMTIPIPCRELMSEFGVTAGEYFKKIRFNQVQISTLEKLRDGILPKLMSGEIRVY